MITEMEFIGLINPAIKQAKIELLKSQELDRQAAVQKSLWNQTAASKILANIPTKIIESVRNNQTDDIEIMKVGESEQGKIIYGKPGGLQCDPVTLSGCSKIIWDYCTEAGLEPTLQYWWDGDRQGGFKICVCLGKILGFK